MEKARIKINFVYIVYVCILVGLFALSFNVFGVTSKVIRKVYPECVIDNGEFVTERVVLKEFAYNSDGSIYSETADPWIYLSFTNLGITDRVKTLQLNISDASNLGETVLVYYVNSYNSQAFRIEKGVVDIPLLYDCEDQDGLRLDLTASFDKTLWIDKITLNDNAYLSAYYCEILKRCLIWLVVVAIVYVVSRRKLLVKENKTGKKLSIYQKVAQVAYIGIGLLFLFNSGDITNVGDQIAISIMLFLILGLFWCARTDMAVVIMSYMAMHAFIQCSLNTYTGDYYYDNVMFAGILAVNIMLNVLWVFLWQGLLGKRLGNLVYAIFSIVYLVANIIKLKYQDALISVADLKLIKEIIGIAPNYVTGGQFALILLALVVLCVGIVRYRKALAQYFKPHFSWRIAPAFLAFGIYVWLIISNVFNGVGINVEGDYLTDKARINAMGYGVYTVLEFSGRQGSNEPDGYGEGIVQEVAVYKDHSSENDIQPTVILILAESLFEVQNIPEVEFNVDLFSNIGKYKTTNVISPSYGGRTAAAEFEALTGLSDLFIQGDTVVYTAYLNKTNHPIGSLAREFSNNGYQTYAIHANRANYYNRDVVYQNMGFDDFISKEDFELTNEDILGDTLVKDSAFADMIIETLESTDEPTFIFGASLEGHSPYGDKYESTEVVASSNIYSTDVLEELSNYGQAMYNFDRQIGRVIEYLETTGEPAMIYIFGDHLPPLAISEENGYLNDVWLKYRTPLFVYSNFCDTTIENEYISISQIAPEILKKSGISYSAYFDYIYKLRNSYPVTHKNVVSNLQDESLQLYNRIQWDMMFGDRYLIK